MSNRISCCSKFDRRRQLGNRMFSPPHYGSSSSLPYLTPHRIGCLRSNRNRVAPSRKLQVQFQFGVDRIEPFQDFGMVWDTVGGSILSFFALNQTRIDDPIVDRCAGGVVAKPSTRTDPCPSLNLSGSVNASIRYAREEMSAALRHEPGTVAGEGTRHDVDDARERVTFVRTHLSRSAEWEHVPMASFTSDILLRYLLLPP